MPLVGVLPAVTFPVTEVDLRPGDQIIWFTDGLIEQPNGRFVEDDLDPFLCTLGRAGPGAVAIADALAERAGTDDEREDDVAILVVEVEAVAAPEMALC